MMDNFANCRVGIVGGNALAAAIAHRMDEAGIDVLSHNVRAPEGTSVPVSRPLSPGRPRPFAEVIDQEIVVLALPWSDLTNLLTEVRDWEGRILVDATNPPTGNGHGVFMQDDKGSSHAVAGMSFGAQVVKCFNTLSASLIAQSPIERSWRRVLFVSGDHPRAKRIVCEMLDVMGFAAIDLGGLVEGGCLQGLPGGPLANRNLMLAPS
jgi:8-hydroxy-5-deazaflavin:NADPH oxidoreductase